MMDATWPQGAAAVRWNRITSSLPKFLQILFKFSKFSSSCVSVCSVWFWCVVFRLLLVCGSFRLDCFCFSIFDVSVIVLVSFWFDSRFVLWRISRVSRSENQPFFIIILTWSACLLWLIKWWFASVLKIVKCRHTDAKNSKLGGKIRNRFFWSEEMKRRSRSYG